MYDRGLIISDVIISKTYVLIVGHFTSGDGWPKGLVSVYGGDQSSSSTKVSRYCRLIKSSLAVIFKRSGTWHYSPYSPCDCAILLRGD